MIEMIENEIEKIWTEKYRPKKLSEMVGQENIINRLQSFVDKNSLPHCLFSGPAGIGKTTASLCIAREFFGDNWSANFLELNASDERGIDTIRNKVKNFARTKPINASFKIIYLDEADSLTPDAQQALRRTMETYSNTCRFILSCNYASKIISPIQSRCAVFKFSKLDKDDIKKYIKRVAENEKISLDDDAIEVLLEYSEGDMRRIMNLLQTSSHTDNITKDHVLEILNLVESSDIDDLLDNALKGNFKKTRSKLYEILFDKGVSSEDLIKQIHKKVYDLDISDDKKVNLLIKTGEYEFRLTEGSNEVIQLEALLANFYIILSKKLSESD
jgi:replication factor C small subunit